jgi:hypothetical protein
LPKEKSLAKKKYKFFQEKKIQPRKDIGFAKREKFNQEEI